MNKNRLAIEQMFCIIRITECTKISASLPSNNVKQKKVNSGVTAM